MRTNRMAILVTSLAIVSAAGLAQGTEGEQAQQVTCTGKIVDAEGKPVAGTKVKLYKLAVNSETFTYDVELAQELTTEEDGVFTIKAEASTDSLSGQAIVLAEKEGLAFGWTNWRLSEDHEADIKLDRAQVLAGIVVDDVGKPVPNAEVSISFLIVLSKGQPQFLVSAPSLGLLITRTDAEGRFYFDRIPTEASAEFLVKKSGKATVNTFDTQNYRGQSLQFSSGQTDIKLTLPVEAKIEGRVVEKASGKPAGGIRIIVLRGRNQPNFGIEPVISDDNGAFSINALDSGTHIVQLVPPAGKPRDWTAEPVEVRVETGKTKSGVRIEVSKGGLLEVVITEAVSNEPVEGARVSVRHRASNEYFNAVSEEKGIARIRLIPGEYQMTGINKEGYSRQRQEETVMIEDGKTTRIEQQLTGLPKIAGVVRDEKGNPIQGVKLKVCPMSTGQDISSDAEGKFQVTWDPASWHSGETPAMVLLGRYEQGNLAAAVEVDESTRRQDITLRPALTITGRAVDPNGKGIANARINTMLRGPRWGSSIGRNQPTADEDGRFEIKALPIENSYSLYTSAEGYGTNRTEEINADDAVNDKLDIGDVTLPVADLSISGVVVDNDDKPAVGVSVSCSGDNQQASSRTQTGEDGTFTLNGVCAGKARLSANKYVGAPLHGYVETEGGATDVKIVISQSSSSTRYVPKRPPSLVRRPLPELKDLGIDLSSASTSGKMILVCFLDIEQRPSRNCLRQLSSKVQELKAKGVVVAAVQASKIDQNSLDEWARKYNISFPLGMVQGDQEKARFTWGVRSLPWLILTDSRHVVAAGGFRLSELDAKIKQIDGD